MHALRDPLVVYRWVRPSPYFLALSTKVWVITRWCAQQGEMLQGMDGAVRRFGSGAH